MRLQKFVLGICAVLLAISLPRCSSSNSNSTATPTPTPTPNNPNPTHFAKRVLLSVQNPTGGDVLIADGLHDALAIQTVGAPEPSKMVTANGLTAILDTAGNNVRIFNNAGEVLFFSTTMQALPVDVAITSDGKTVFAAIKNKGVVEAVDTATGNLVATVTVPTPARLTMSPQGTKLLVFSDDPQSIPGSPNAFFVIDVGSVVGTPTATAITGTGLDQPYTAVFNNSETSVFVLNCGPQCGGTTASVSPVTLGSPSSVGTAIPVPGGATVGLLSGSNLFVAGTPVPALPNSASCPFQACGTMSVVSTSSMSVSGTAPVTDGLHQVMAMSPSNHLYIGASQCSVGAVNSQNQVQSCLGIVNTSGNTSIGPLLTSAFRVNFNVTALQPISTRNIIYVVQGGGVDIFDTTIDSVSPTIEPFNISGVVIDALQIDP